MARNSEGFSRDSRPRRSTWRERAFVLAALALAVPVTSAAPVLGLEDHAVGLVWAAALAWTVAASLAAALRSGIAHGDWSAFARGPRRDGRAERFDWDTRSGVWAWRRVADRRRRLFGDTRAGDRR